MKWAALIAWVITALGGFGLLGIWLRNGGLAAGSRPGARIRAPRVFSHMGLAATGLVLWIIYLAADKDAIAWAAVIVLGPVAILGFSMLAIWIQQRQRQPGTAGAPGPTASASGGASGSTGAVPAGGERPPEQHFPVPVVVVHGLLAVTTLILAILASAGVGGS